MNPSQVLLLAFLIGVVAGLRSLTAPAAVARGAHRNRINLHNTPPLFMGLTAAVVIFTLVAFVELVADQLPSTPSRTRPLGNCPAFLLSRRSKRASRRRRRTCVALPPP